MRFTRCKCPIHGLARKDDIVMTAVVMSKRPRVLWLELWKQRNEDRHGRDLASLNLKTREQAIREAELLYAMKTDVQAELQYAFQSPWNTFITKPTNTIRMWLSLHRANLHRSAAPTVPD